MSRTRAISFIVAGLLFAGAGAACGTGDDVDEDSTLIVAVQPTAAGEAPPQPTAAPTGPEATPAPTDTPEPTATTAPAATPTVAELTFDTAQGADSSKSAPSLGPLGIVYADSSSGFDIGADRLVAAAFVNIGINERPTASAYLNNLFRVPGEGTTPITAQISTGVRWQGVLAGNGAGGTRAAVTITLSVLEDGATVASEQVHFLEQRESALTLGGFDDISRTDADMEVAVVPGRLYELRLTLTCDASSGLIGVATHCVYGASDTYDDGFVEWEQRRILFVP